MEWTGDPLIGRGVREQGFRVECDGRTVPGLLWTTESADEAHPLVLLGHGGTIHKRADYILATARRLVRHHGISALAIDGPGHGERRSEAEGEMVLMLSRRSNLCPHPKDCGLSGHVEGLLTSGD